MPTPKDLAAKAGAKAVAPVETIEVQTNEIDQVLSDAPGIVDFSNLQAPEKFTVIGAVEQIKFKEKDFHLGGKFRHDTHIVSLSCPKRGHDGIKFETVLVFITDKQWDSYGCEPIVYRGNYLKVDLEKCIEGVTGYQKEVDDEFLTEHTNSYNSFVNCVEAVADVMMMYFDGIGLSERMSDRIIANLSQLRISRSELESEKEALRQFDRR